MLTALCKKQKHSRDYAIVSAIIDTGVAEHHASDALAGSSPEVLLGRLRTETQNIRLGSGGIMLPQYSPY